MNILAIVDKNNAVMENNEIEMVDNDIHEQIIMHKQVVKTLHVMET